MLLHKRGVYKGSGRKCMVNPHHQHLHKRIWYQMDQQGQQMKIVMFFSQIVSQCVENSFKISKIGDYGEIGDYGVAHPQREAVWVGQSQIIFSIQQISMYRLQYRRATTSSFSMFICWYPLSPRMSNSVYIRTHTLPLLGILIAYACMGLDSLF